MLITVMPTSLFGSQYSDDNDAYVEYSISTI